MRTRSSRLLASGRRRSDPCPNRAPSLAGKTRAGRSRGRSSARVAATGRSAPPADDNGSRRCAPSRSRISRCPAGWPLTTLAGDAAGAVGNGDERRCPSATSEGDVDGIDAAERAGNALACSIARFARRSSREALKRSGRTVLSRRHRANEPAIAPPRPIGNAERGRIAAPRKAPVLFWCARACRAT